MIEKTDKGSYKQIIKATSLFGGVQVFNILIALVRSKFVAVLLGTQGIGLMGLLQSTTGLISSITGLGINLSAVRDISEASEGNNKTRITNVIITFRRWIWFTGLLGAFLTIVMAPWLSQLTFGNKDFTGAFIWLSITLLFNTLTSGQNTLLQGMRYLKNLAKASILGSTLGLLVSIPLYYWLGLKGIIPTLIITSFISLVIAYYFSRMIQIEKKGLPIYNSLTDGLAMIKLGVLMTLSGFLGTLVSYLINIFISKTGGLTDVGLYQAGFGITDKYVGVIFSAMATDYFPRLAAVNSDNSKVNLTINQQAEITILILSPILIILLSTVPIVIQIFYTKAFLPIIGLIQWLVLGMLFKAMSWVIGMIILAKGHSKLFFITELIARTIILSFSLLGYHFMNLEGLGISFNLSYFLYLIIIFFIVRHRYQFKFIREFYRIFFTHMVGCLLAFLFAKFLGYPWAYLSGSILFIVLGYYSWNELGKRIGLPNLSLKQIFKK